MCYNSEMEEEPRKWLWSAKQDLIDFKGNYNRGERERALYFLQQTSEKLAKTVITIIGFSSSFESIPQLKLIGLDVVSQKKYRHTWREKLINQLEDMAKNPISRFCFEILENYGIHDPIRLIENAKKVESLKSPQKEDIRGILEICDELLEATEKSIDISDSITLIEVLLSLISVSDIDVKHLESEFNYLLKLAFILGILLLLSIVLDPLNELRYPSDKNINPYIPFIDRIEHLLKSCISLVDRQE
jgi:HEPN domain-containing protein